MTNGTSTTAKQQEERREFERVTVSVPGRYMLEDRREFPCRTIDFSPNGVSLAGPVRGNEGERVIVYLDFIGRLEGTVVRHNIFGFSLALAFPGNRREKLADQLSWLLNREALGKLDRRHERIIPNLRHCILQFKDDREHFVKLIDVSVSGAAIATDLKIRIGTQVRLGSTSGHIVRHFEGGMAIEFGTPIPIETFDENLRL